MHVLHLNSEFSLLVSISWNYGSSRVNLEPGDHRSHLLKTRAYSGCGDIGKRQQKVAFSNAWRTAFERLSNAWRTAFERVRVRTGTPTLPNGLKRRLFDASERVRTRLNTSVLERVYLAVNSCQLAAIRVPRGTPSPHIHISKPHSRPFGRF